MTRHVTALTIGLVCLTTFARAGENRHLNGLPDANYVLARATMLGQHEADGYLICRYKVEYVYAGPVGLQIGDFEYRHPSPDRTIGSGPRYLSEPPKVGDTAIWLIRCDGAKAVP